jgi:putative peptide zinc metalloprotease protein
MAEGIIWAPDNAFVRAGTDGFVERLLIPSGIRVQAGQPLVECHDPLLPAEIRVLEAKIKELEAIYDGQVVSDRVKAELTKKEIEYVSGKLDDAFVRAADLIVRSPCSGNFIVPVPQDLPGRFLKRGELLGYVLEQGCLSVRVVINQSEVDLVRHMTRAVHVRFPEHLAKSVPAIMTREVPAATDQVPGRALTREGGGQIAIDPQDRLGIKSFQKIFLFDIELSEHEGFHNVGGRVHVRFDHGHEPLVWRWYRVIRRVFLRKFSV